jgi:serine phosphatase RsbU (regulator of sigma subunit)
MALNFLKPKYYNILGFRKIVIGFTVVIVIALFNAVYTTVSIQKNKHNINRITNEINPYVDALNEFNLLVIKSKMLITNWVYLKSNEVDKFSLIDIQNKQYPRLKEKILEYDSLLNRTNHDSLTILFSDFEGIVQAQNSIQVLLTSMDDYEISMKYYGAEDVLATEIIPKTKELTDNLNRIILKEKQETDRMKDETSVSFSRLVLTIIVSGFGLFILVLMAAFYISKSIRSPVVRMKDILLRLGRGELPKERIREGKDVIGEMASAVNSLVFSFSETANFANEIGKGNFDTVFVPLSEEDLLGNSLINMRDSLKKYSGNLEQQVTERTKEVVEKTEKLKIAYDEIRDSINYAKRIQEAISPSDELVHMAFKDSFILFRPKDIISGDFYWFTQEGDQAVIAAIDCTGHGVPGALMTVIGNSLLNQIVNIANIHNPGEILKQLDEKVLETLNSHGTGDTNDGMDVSICIYNAKANEIKFAGAKRSMYLIREGKCQEIEGDKFPIGSFQYNFKKVYKTHTVALKPEDSVYLFTDGYQDQFGANEKKFLKKRFRELLIGIQEQTMKEQRVRLEKEIDTWRGNTEQTDDILVIGMRF